MILLRRQIRIGLAGCSQKTIMFGPRCGARSAPSRPKSPDSGPSAGSPITTSTFATRHCDRWCCGSLRSFPFRLPIVENELNREGVKSRKLPYRWLRTLHRQRDSGTAGVLNSDSRTEVLHTRAHGHEFCATSTPSARSNTAGTSFSNGTFRFTGALRVRYRSRGDDFAGLLPGNERPGNLEC